MMRRVFPYFILFSVLCSNPVFSFGVLAHEAVIDQLWESSLQPLLLAKYPGATREELNKARAYAYGGAILPDIGYFPFGSARFSDLVHYVRSGDFVRNLILESRSLYQYAFALGVMTHYEADRIGHMDCTNKAVPMMFPKLRKKYGDDVPYEKGCRPHGRMEFGFDVVQTARGNYASKAYHDFIGFEVNDTVLEKAFVKTYGRELDDLFRSFSLAVSVFRFAVRKAIPELTRDAWKIKNSFITKMNPLATKQTYIYKVDRRKYRKDYKQPVVPSIFITILVAALPKVSTLSSFNPMMPDEPAEKLFESSFDNILPHCAARCVRLRTQKDTPKNVNLDTGRETRRGEYVLADEAHDQLLLKLQKNNFEYADEELKKELLAYYGNPDTLRTASRKEKKIRMALAGLEMSSTLQSTK